MAGKEGDRTSEQARDRQAEMDGDTQRGTKESGSENFLAAVFLFLFLFCSFGVPRCPIQTAGVDQIREKTGATAGVWRRSISKVGLTRGTRCQAWGIAIKANTKNAIIIGRLSTPTLHTSRWWTRLQDHGCRI